MTDDNVDKEYSASALERRAIGFLIAKVAVFLLIPILASVIAVYFTL